MDNALAVGHIFIALLLYYHFTLKTGLGVISWQIIACLFFATIKKRSD
jgi:hypothetical protein